MHLGLEKDIPAMERYYYGQYPVINDNHINEMIKLTQMVTKAKLVLDELVEERPTTFEHEINFPTFRGFVDLIIHNKDGTVNVYDFKYSNHIDRYLESKQLHLYKYFLEQEGFVVGKLGFVFIAKTQIRQKKTESLYQFRKRLYETLSNMNVTVVTLKYNQSKVDAFFDSCKEIEKETKYEKTPSNLCPWCEYQQYCEKEIDYMLLPSNVRRERKIDVNPDMWVYADSYVGKSTFADKFDDLLFVNTDGNVDNTTSPVFRIADEVSFEGRLRKERLSWEVFLDLITELEKKENTFERVCIDLVEDLYEHCRLYVYRKLGVDHEQDAGFGKGWDMVRTEFLSAMKRLKNLGYQLIMISKEVTTEITLKNGNKITTIKPNINDKVANVLAGIVDLTIRAYMDDQDRFIQLEKKENVFGGGRFDFKVDKVKLDKDEFITALATAQEGIKTYSKVETSPAQSPKADEPVVENQPTTETETTKPATRARRSKNKEAK